MGTIVKPCDDYIHMLEVRESLDPKIKELHDFSTSNVWNPLFILGMLNHKLFCKVIYDAICFVIAERNNKNVSSKYLVADTSIIDALCMHLMGECPGFETSNYLYNINILGIKLEVIQCGPRPSKGKYDFLIL